MINVSDRYRCIFIHVPKCAGTSLKQALDLPGQGHPTWYWFAEKIPHKWNTYLKFAIVRNPWDRFVSAYFYATMKKSYWHNDHTGLHPDYSLLSNKSFDECCVIAQRERQALKHEAWYPQHLWLTLPIGGQNKLMVDLVLRYEKLDEDMALLSARLGLESIDLPRINVTQHRCYRDYYNEETRAIVAGLYGADISLLGYEF
jgi:hypothetical protein